MPKRVSTAELARQKLKQAQEDLDKNRLKSSDWFRSLITNKKARNYFRPGKDILIGSMFLYEYDPKYKEKLPIWDEFPLVIPIDIYHNGFLAINFHFLEVKDRIKLLAILAKNPSYQVIKSVSNYIDCSKAIKRYLVDHITSKLVIVEKGDMDKAILLPIAKFYTN